MSQLENWIEEYRKAAKARTVSEEIAQDLEHRVMRSLPQRRVGYLPDIRWALAAAAVLMITVISWPDRHAANASASDQLAQVESVFYLEDHVAFWLEYPGNETGVEGEAQ